MNAIASRFEIPATRFAASFADHNGLAEYLTGDDIISLVDYLCWESFDFHIERIDPVRDAFESAYEAEEAGDWPLAQGLMAHAKALQALESAIARRFRP